jgi:hypothetical protein
MSQTKMENLSNASSTVDDDDWCPPEYLKFKSEHKTYASVYEFTKQLLSSLELDTSDANFKYELHYMCCANPRVYAGEGFTKYYCTPVTAFFKARMINTKLGEAVMKEPLASKFLISSTIHYEQFKDFNYKSICIVENISEAVGAKSAEGKKKFKSSPTKPFMIHVSVHEKSYKDNKYYYSQIDQADLPKSVLDKIHEIEDKYMKEVDVKPTVEEQQEMFEAFLS